MTHRGMKQKQSRGRGPRIGEIIDGVRELQAVACREVLHNGS